MVGGCLNVNLVIGFGPNPGLALWPRAKPINYPVVTNPTIPKQNPYVVLIKAFVQRDV